MPRALASAFLCRSGAWAKPFANLSVMLYTLGPKRIVILMCQRSPAAASEICHSRGERREIPYAGQMMVKIRQYWDSLLWSRLLASKAASVGLFEPGLARVPALVENPAQRSPAAVR